MKWPTIKRLACALMIIGAGHPLNAMSDLRDHPQTVATDQPVMLCLPVDASLQPALSNGQRRAVLVVHAVQSADGSSGSFVIRHTGTGRQSRIGLFPGGPFSEDNGDQPRRYLLPQGIGQDGSLCFDIRYLAANGTARVSLSLSDPL